MNLILPRQVVKKLDFPIMKRVFPIKSIFLAAGLLIHGGLYTSSIAFGKVPSFNVLNIKDAENLFGSDGNPPDRTSGGGRGACLEQLIALVPGSPLADCNAVDADLESYSKSYLAQTVNESPTFWIFVPEGFRSAPAAELVLLDENENLLWSNTIEPFQISQDQGIIRLPLTYSLEEGQNYRWLFTITLNPDNFDQNPTVGGVIEYVIPTGDLTQQMEQVASQPEQVDEIYTQHGIWHDALTLSAEQLSLDPSNEIFRAEWLTLLTSVGLSELADAPIMNCCLSTP